jgi:MoaA/NifB/PqqE/SkfB family radical SAM enzyme
VVLDKRDLYRLPWSLNDNPIAWLEVTDICNLRCEGCYRQRLTGHKPLEDVQEEILFLKRWRNPDNVSIAGGEPLLHPDIVAIVRFIAEQGIKPVLLSNGLGLDPQLLRELKRAGLSGFTLHVDSHQGRPEWRGKSEAEHNALRQHYAEMIAEVGGLITIFNATVYPATFPEIPAVVRWAKDNIRSVQGVVFITYRIAATDNQMALDSSAQQVDLSRLSYSVERFDEEFVTGPEVCQAIHECLPEYEPSGYLGGTLRHDSFKWIIGAVVGSQGGVYGAVGKPTMEVAQAGHHLWRGTYLAYLNQPRIGAKVFLMSPWDRSVRRAARNWLAAVVRDPGRLFESLRLQSYAIIQAPDIQPDGRADMCDSCPDMTFYNGTLINSCRMDEYRLFGGPLSLVDRARVAAATESPSHPADA